MQQLSSTKSFGGLQNRYQHSSTSLNCEMTFSIFLPKVASEDKSVRLPVLYWLSGLTCTDENFVQKACAQRVASELGLIIVAPDTSPRGDDIPDADSYDLGMGAGFYVNATAEPWLSHYQMYDYIARELPELINAQFPVDSDRQGIFGHSMGGHGALTIALKNPASYRSVSAFAPICSPINCPWGQKALASYLGDDITTYAAYDAVELLKVNSQPVPMLIDQGGDDEFLAEQLKPELLVTAATAKNYPLTFNEREGYDHSYFFIASFIEEHLRFHHEILVA